MIYLAPIQGFTDFVYRKAFSEIFSGIDVFFIPYISVKNESILKKYEAEILPENNLQLKVIPQVLVKDSIELMQLSGVIKNYGYTELNLNLGCPYPMVTNRGKGAGLLPHSEKIKQILSNFFEKSDLKLSIKLRAGLNDFREIEQLIPVLNQFPLTEIIFHPRIAKQLYKGKIYEDVFAQVKKQVKPELVYNGDIFSLADFEQKSLLFETTKNWMIGRGVLQNPFLPAEITGKIFTAEMKYKMLLDFHELIFKGYSEKMDNKGNVLNKMKQFWSYFSFNFPKQHKVFKKIKKSKDLNIYNAEVKQIFLEIS